MEKNVPLILSACAALLVIFLMSCVLSLFFGDARGKTKVLAKGIIEKGARYFGSLPIVIRFVKIEGIQKGVDYVSEVSSNYGLVVGFQSASGLLVEAMLVAACLGGLLSGSAAGFLLGPVLTLVASSYLGSSRKRKEEQESYIRMPQTLISLSRGLAAGHSFQVALEQTARYAPALVAESFSHCSYDMRVGKPADEAIDEMIERIDFSGSNLLGCALEISRKTGAPLKGILEEVAAVLEEEVALRRELEVKTAQARFSALIVGIMPVIMIGLLVLMSPDYREGVCSGTGILCVLISLLMDGVAFLIIKSIMEVDM